MRCPLVPGTCWDRAVYIIHLYLCMNMNISSISHMPTIQLVAYTISPYLTCFAWSSWPASSSRWKSSLLPWQQLALHLAAIAAELRDGGRSLVSQEGHRHGLIFTQKMPKKVARWISWIHGNIGWNVLKLSYFISGFPVDSSGTKSRG